MSEKRDSDALVARLDFLSRLRLFEKVFVQTSELDSSVRSNPYSMLDHQACQTCTIEKDNPLGKVLYEVARLRAERRGSDKDALARAEPDQATHKSLHIGPTDSIPGRVALGLNIDAIEPQPVFIDHSIDAPVTRSAELGSGVLM